MRHFMLIATVVATGALTGCFTSDDDNNSSAAPVKTDSFTSAVAKEIAMPTATADMSEAIEITAFVETSPDNTEPVLVTF